MAGPDVTKARKAQEWMSWTLPVRCETTAATLEQRSRLMGASLRANTEAEPAPTTETPASEAPAPAVEAPAPTPN